MPTSQARNLSACFTKKKRRVLFWKVRVRCSAVTKKSASIFADLSPLVGECTTWSMTALCSKLKNVCMREPRANNCQNYLFHRALGCASLSSRVCVRRLLIGDSSFHIQGRQCGIVWLHVAHSVPHEHPNQAKHNEKNKGQNFEKKLYFVGVQLSRAIDSCVSLSVLFHKRINGGLGLWQ